MQSMSMTGQGAAMCHYFVTADQNTADATLQVSQQAVDCELGATAVAWTYWATVLATASRAWAQAVCEQWLSPCEYVTSSGLRFAADDSVPLGLQHRKG
ncbi:hypothetical protein ABBQ32_001578 [Trebouxia sp. C0010 RCD-2024]